MKKNLLTTMLTAFILIFGITAGWAQDDLVISQYIDTDAGTSPKGIEVWNVSGSDIDFSVTPLTVFKGANGGATALDVTVNSGTLVDGDVWVIGTADIGTYLTNEGLGTNYTSFAFTFNGDDALEIYLDGTLNDIFGTPNSDPGDEWVGNGVSTMDQNIGLLPGIFEGATAAWTDPSLRFQTITTDNSLTDFGLAPAQTFNIIKMLLGAADGVTAASVYTVDPTAAEADEIVTVEITNMPVGYEFVSLAVAPVANSTETTVADAIPTEEGKYTFAMPAEEAYSILTIQKRDYNVTQLLVGSEAAASTVFSLNPSPAQFENTVHVLIDNMLEGYQFVDLAVVEADNSVDGTLEVSEVTEGEDYTFVMPAEPVIAILTIEKRDYTVTVANIVGESTGVAPQPTATTGFTVLPATAQIGDELTISVTDVTEGFEIVSINLIDTDITSVEIESFDATDLTDGITTFAMVAKNITATLTLAAKSYDITKDFSAEGITGFTAPATADAYSLVTVSDFLLSEGYELVSLGVSYLDGTVSVPIDVTALGGKADEAYTFAMPAADVTAVANVQKKSYTVTTEIVGDVATGATTAFVANPTSATMGDIITLNISTITEGYDFASVAVSYTEGTVVTPVTTTMVTEGEEYTFAMPAKNVTATLTVQERTYAITTEVVGDATTGATTVFEAVPATAAADAVVTLNISNVTEGYLFESVAVASYEGTVATDITTTQVTEGEQYTFIMPAKEVEATLNLRPVVSAVISPVEAGYPVGLVTDLDFDVTYNDATEVLTITDDQATPVTLVVDEDYTIETVEGVTTLTILDTYLTEVLLAIDDVVELTVEFDLGDDVVLTITGVAQGDNIVSVADLSPVYVTVETAFEDINLPASVDVTLDDVDATVETLDIVWGTETQPAYDAATPGTYVLEGELQLIDGVLNPDGLVATVNIIVMADAPGYSWDFEEGMPADWTLIDGDCGWITGTEGSSEYFTIPAHTVYAYVNDDECNGDMSDVWMITNAIDFSSYVAPKLSFATFNKSDIFTIKVSVDGTTWEDLAVLDNYTEWTTVEFDLAAYAGEPSVQIAFHYNDNGAWGYGWAVDDVEIYQPVPNDLAVANITPTFVMSGETVVPQVTLENVGTADQATWSVTLTDGADYTSTMSDIDVVVAGGILVVEMDEWTPAEGEHTLTATVTLNGDANTENDMLEVGVLVGTYLDAYVGNTTLGVYNSINLEDGTLADVNFIGTDPFPMAEEFDGNVIYRIYSDMSIGTVSPDGEFSELGIMTGFAGTPTGLAYDWDNDVMYVVVLDDASASTLFTLDMTTYELTQVGESYADAIIAMDFAWDGNIYAPSLGDVLYKINPADGTFMEVGDIGMDIAYGQDVSFDGQTGKLYTVTCGGAYIFGYYDLNTGAIVNIADFDAQYGTFVITKTPADTYDVLFTVTDGTNAIEGAEIDIDGAVLITDVNGQATFTNVAGDFNYVVSMFGYEDASGMFNTETDPTVDVTLTALPGYTVTFNITNTLSESLNADVTLFYEDMEMATGTAIDGTIAFTDVVPATYTYDVVMDGYVSEIGTELIVDGEETVDVVLEESMTAPYGLVVEVNETEASALFTWNNDLYESVELSNHGGVGEDGGYYQSFGQGYGVVFDLTDYPDAIIDAVDFHHVSWGVTGTWEYKFHVADMDNATSAFVTPSYFTTGDDTWETGIDLGDVEGLGGGQVGIFLEPFGNVADDAYPDLNTDGLTEGAVSSYYAVDLSTFVGTPTNEGNDAGDFIMDLWILTANGEKVKAPKRVVTPKVFESYTVYLDDAEVATGLTVEEYTFTELTQGEHVAGVKAIYSSGETAISEIDFSFDVSINEVSSSINVYPNPSTGLFTVDVDGQYNVKVFDITGKVISTSTINVNNNTIDLSSQTAGMYFIQLVGEKTINFQVVKK